MTDVGIAKRVGDGEFELFIPGNKYLGVTDKQFDIFNVVEEMYKIKDWEFTQENDKKSNLRILFKMTSELDGLLILLTERMEEFNEIDKLWHEKMQELKKIQKQIGMCLNER